MKKVLLASLISILVIYSCNSSGGGKKENGADSLGIDYVKKFPLPTQGDVSVIFRTSDSTGALIPAVRVIQPSFKLHPDTLPIKSLTPFMDTMWFIRTEKGVRPFPKDSLYWHKNLGNMRLDSVLRTLPPIKK